MDWTKTSPLFHTGFWALALAFFFPRAISAQTLDQRINALIHSAKYAQNLNGAEIGLQIGELSPHGMTVLFDHHGDLPLAPASNTKLLTTAAAFARYGAKGTCRTELYQAGPDLVIVGGGDPALGDAKLCAAAGWTVTTVFDSWADHLKKTGVTAIRDVIVDDSAFDDEFVHPNWPANQHLDWYEAPIGALNFNDNCLDWEATVGPDGIGIALTPPNSYVSVEIKATHGPQRVWLWRPEDSNAFEMRGTVHASATEPESVSIVDPGMWTGTILRDRLAAAGINCTGGVKRGKLSAGKLVAVHETPLPLILKRADKNSVNMMAEVLCKKLGYDATGQPGSWENGTTAVHTFLKSIGAADQLVTLEDGSGLSPNDRVPAEVFTTVLAHAAAQPDGQIFVDALAVPGEDGTLKHRFEHLSVASAVHAKTGHISGVSTLSGVIDASGRRFVFSILVNHYQGNVNPWQDEVCEAIYQWAGGGK